MNSGEKVKTRRTESESKKTPKRDRGKVKVAKESLEKQRINNVELLCPGYPCPSGSSPGYHYDVNFSKYDKNSVAMTSITTKTKITMIHSVAETMKYNDNATGNAIH